VNETNKKYLGSNNVHAQTNVWSVSMCVYCVCLYMAAPARHRIISHGFDLLSVGHSCSREALKVSINLPARGFDSDGRCWKMTSQIPHPQNDNLSFFSCFFFFSGIQMFKKRINWPHYNFYFYKSCKVVKMMQYSRDPVSNTFFRRVRSSTYPGPALNGVNYTCDMHFVLLIEKWNTTQCWAHSEWKMHTNLSCGEKGWILLRPACPVSPSQYTVSFRSL